MPSSSSHHIASPLGDLHLRVEFEPGTTLEQLPLPELLLPGDMSIDGAALVRVKVLSQVSPDQPLTLEVSADFYAEPESGEWLDSVLFVTPRGRLQVGLCDAEWMKSVGLDGQVNYTPHGLKLIVSRASADSALLVSVAWRFETSDSDDVSTWFAVELALRSYVR